MRKFLVAGVAVLLFLIPMMCVIAATEHKYQEGTCPTGQTWWCVTTFENGQATFAQGLNCKGERYYYHVGRVVVSSNPITGMTAMYRGNCGSGSVLSNWHAVAEFNEDAEPSWIGGESCDGIYWIATSFTDAEAGPGGGGQ